jgi:hypothetical protein
LQEYFSELHFYGMGITRGLINPLQIISGCIHPKKWTGKPGRGNHVNFETFIPNPAKPGKMLQNLNFHVYLIDQFNGNGN